uniref:CSON015467 protein n=1 Tax=Culicoides sonorensis TaxID=179676 RepID=A0A336KVK3_CULSO
MSHLISFLIKFSIFIKNIHNSIQFPPEFQCYPHIESELSCQIRNLQLPRDEEFLCNEIENVVNITQLTVLESKIPVLNLSICNFLPSLKRFDAQGLRIHKIQENTFEKCTELEVVDLTDNKINVLPKNLFQNNLALMSIKLDSNRLKKLDDEIFINLPELQFLSIADNNLTEFSPFLLKRNQKLSFIYIFLNNLSDLDLEKLHEVNPNLRSINMNLNEISCSRISEMIVFAEENWIALSRHSFGTRTRFYEVKEYERFFCLDDVTWAANHYRKQIEENYLNKYLIVY